MLSGAAVYRVVMTTSQSSVSSDWQDPATVDRMLDEAQTWAVVGLSGDPGRTAYSIAALLQERGKRIVPVHPVFADPGAPAVLGEQGYATLADVPVPIDVVDVRGVRRDLGIGDRTDRLTNRLVLLGEGIDGEVRAHGR